MRYRRMPIEIESPEQMGYGNIAHNLSESSITDVPLRDLNLNLGDLVMAYGDHYGLPELRELVAGEGDGLHADDVLLTVGAAAALFIVNTSLLQAGDHMIVAHPNYATNVETPRAIGCSVTTLPLRFEDGFRLDIDRLEASLTPQTRLISLTCPHNPTGQMLTKAELQRIIQIVERQGCYLLFDETYREMAYGSALPLAASLSARAISVSSLSKTYGLPGIRMGWLISGNPVLMERFLAAKEQIFISNSVVDEAIALHYLRDKAAHLQRIKAHIAERFQITKSWMESQTAFEWIEPKGGVVSFPRIRPDLPVDVDRFYAILNGTYKTFVGPGHWFEQDRRYMRLGFGWPGLDELRGGLANLSRAVAEASITS